MENHTLQKSSEITNGSNLIEVVQLAAGATKLCWVKDEELKNALKNIYAMMGIRADQVPEEEEKGLLHSYIRKELKHYSLIDMKLAFMLYVQKKLDWTELLYSKFSILFLENVMQSYKRWKVALPKQPIQNMLPELTDSEKKRVIHMGAIECFIRYAKTGIVIDFGNITYNYLEKCGIINLSDERKWNLYHAAEKKLNNPENLKSIADWIKSNRLAKTEDQDERKERIIREAKRLALAQYFDELIEMQIELKDQFDEE